jgi:AAA domain/Bifunctional DNA primase/polymerase, N-terminal
MTTQRKLYIEGAEKSSPGEDEATTVRRRSRRHEAARWYAQHNIPIFQGEPGDKVPLRRLGAAEATTDLTVIDKWFTEEPDANIFARPSDFGMIAIIVDKSADASWLTDLDALGTRSHESPRSSVHYLIGVRPEDQFVDGALLDTGVTVRCGKGYIALPTSAIEMPDGSLCEYRLRSKDILPVAAPEELLQKLRGASPPPTPDTSDPLSWDEWMEVPDPVMVVEKLVPSKKLVLVWGDTGCGKTYYLLELAAKIAWRLPIYDTFQVHLPRRGGVVVIFAGEDATELVKSRLQVLAIKHNRSPEGRIFVSLPLDNDEARKLLIQKVREIKEKTGREIDAIFNDTLGRSLGSLDPNSAEVGQFFSVVMEGLVEEFGCPVICTAHKPKGGEDIAGSKIFQNNAPVTAYIEGSFEGTLLTEFTVAFRPKYRIGKPPAPFSVSAEEITLPRPVNGSTTDIVFNMSAVQPEDVDNAEAERGCLAVLAEFGEDGVGRGVWQKACEEQKVASRGTFDKILPALLQSGMVKRGGTGQRAPYIATHLAHPTVGDFAKGHGHGHGPFTRH